jgi:sensor c-di-GMP phosphodiesterase-like protein
MTVGKQRGSDCVEFFDDSHRSIAEQRIADLRQTSIAIASDEFVLVYQPQVDVVSGTIRGV